MSVSAIDLRVGNIIAFEGGRYRVLKTMHVKPGKGGAFMQVELKEINHETKKNHRFRSDESVDRLYVEIKKMQFMYQDGEQMEFMEISTSEQFSVPISLFDEDREKFLADGMEVNVEFIGEDPVNVVLPSKLRAVVQSTEPYMKGQTVTMAFKPAILENGVKVQVPPFIKEGEEILVSSETMEYDSRA
jgi:elongation factor P